MAKGAWKMTAARKAYYASKKKRGGKTAGKRRGKALGGTTQEMKSVFKRRFKLQMENQKDLRKIHGLPTSGSKVRRAATRWALSDVADIVRSKKSVAKFDKIRKAFAKRTSVKIGPARASYKK